MIINEFEKDSLPMKSEQTTYKYIFFQYHNPSTTLPEFCAIYLDLIESQVSFLQGMDHMGDTGFTVILY